MAGRTFRNGRRIRLSQATIRFEPEVHGWLKAEARRSGQTISDLVREACIRLRDEETAERKLTLMRADLEQQFTPVVERVLVSLFAIEEMIKSSTDPQVVAGIDPLERQNMLIEVAEVAAARTRRLLGY